MSSSLLKKVLSFLQERTTGDDQSPNNQSLGWWSSLASEQTVFIVIIELLWSPCESFAYMAEFICNASDWRSMPVWDRPQSSKRIQLNPSMSWKWRACSLTPKNNTCGIKWVCCLFQTNQHNHTGSQMTNFRWIMGWYQDSSGWQTCERQKKVIPGCWGCVWFFDMFLKPLIVKWKSVQIAREPSLVRLQLSKYINNNNKNQ